ncbi:MAG: hypothetical protein HQL69_22670 [Magnetococcales bacterium]|nr:hypothetical protein [Magnetococcales bacterium]
MEGIDAKGENGMSLYFRHLSLRVHTVEGGLFGVDIPFKITGLNVIWADNTKGKSNCVNAILYALGLEKILTNKKAPPLKSVMTSIIKDDEERSYAVAESYVELEVENQDGSVLSIKRQVAGEGSTDLIQTWDGPKLTQPEGTYIQKDFVGAITGSALRSFGMANYLGQFLGWDIPDVARFEGGTSRLYLETLIPLAFVEQQNGWSVFPARVPTQFGIRDVHKRGVEFFLGLDVSEVEKKKQELSQALEQTSQQWYRLYDRLVNLAKEHNGKLDSVPDQPDQEFSSDEDQEPQLLLSRNKKWIDLETEISLLRERLSELTAAPPKSSEIQSIEAEHELSNLLNDLPYKQAAFDDLQKELSLESDRIQSLNDRLADLEEDLVKHRDAKKLRDIGSTLQDKLSPASCPTCLRKWPSTLLFEKDSNRAMTLEENIDLINGQKDMFQRMKEQSRGVVREKKRQVRAIEDEMISHRSRIRALKETLLSRSETPSVADVQARITLESSIRKLENTLTEFNDLIRRLKPVQKEYKRLLSEKDKLPASGLSEEDIVKLNAWEDRIRNQLYTYGFKTCLPPEISISKQTFKPEQAGFELNIEASASDLIRMKWAYQLGLMEMSSEFSTSRHPQFLILDEPRQQSVNRFGMQELLKRASLARGRNQQVILMTSEEKPILEELLQGVDHHLYSIDGLILKKMPN